MIFELRLCIKGQCSNSHLNMCHYSRCLPYCDLSTCSLRVDLILLIIAFVGLALELLFGIIALWTFQRYIDLLL